MDETGGSEDIKLKFVMPAEDVEPHEKKSEISPFTSKSILDINPFENRRQIPVYFLPVFVGIWFILYLTVVMTQIEYLPTPFSLNDKNANKDRFNAQSASNYLLALTSLGPKVTGSPANEEKAIQLLTEIVNDIKLNSRTDLYDIEVDVQRTTGNYILWEMVNMYRDIQNFVVKFSPKNVTTKSSLLVNSHFDSKPGSPGAGDAGSMVSVMLEILKNLSKSKDPLKYPIVFLFNGAEENPLQASHGFITQHKWAKQCKAFVNLDAGSNHGKEVLFQSGPNHPWLLRHYYSSAWNPVGDTIKEEAFQSGLIPSDTDFRIFRDYGSIPGLDFALFDGGYAYHTKYDTFDQVPIGTLQNTGDNILALIKSIATGVELEDPKPYAEGSVVFFDVCGWFLIFYPESVGIAINYTLSVISLIAIIISVWLMGRNSGLSNLEVFKEFAMIFGVQLGSVLLAIGLNAAVGAFMDAIGYPLVWYGNKWCLFGLYCCPTLFSLILLPSLYLEYSSRETVSLNDKSQLFGHSNCILMIFLTVVGTAVGFKSSFIFMLQIFFYTIYIILNLTTTFQTKQFFWIFWSVSCQILPFLYFAYLGTDSMRGLVPTKGRSGSEANADVQISFFCFLHTWLAIGFLVPILYLFRLSKTILAITFGTVIIFIIIALTPAGFPYTEKYASQRLSVLHSRRVINNYNGSVEVNQPIYYFDTEDRRSLQTLKNIEKTHDLELYRAGEECEAEKLCKFPFFNWIWFSRRNSAYYFPAEIDPDIQNLPTLTLQRKKELKNGRIRYEFNVTGPHHLGIFMAPIGGAKIVNWTFNKTMIKRNWKPPYFMYITSGIFLKPYLFFVELEAQTSTEPILEIGVAGHWVFEPNLFTQEYKDFLAKFPKYVYHDARFSSYESWIY